MPGASTPSRRVAWTVVILVLLWFPAPEPWGNLVGTIVSFPIDWAIATLGWFESLIDTTWEAVAATLPEW